MVSVVRCWKAEYQKCKHSILLYMHSMIPIICAAIFASYYHLSRWELATQISAYLEVLAVGVPFPILSRRVFLSIFLFLVHRILAKKKAASETREPLEGQDSTTCRKDGRLLAGRG